MRNCEMKRAVYTPFSIQQPSEEVRRVKNINKNGKEKKRKIPNVAIYSSAVCKQKCVFGCHSRLAWDLYLNSWQTWQCSFFTWLPQRPLSTCHSNQIVTRLSPVTPPLTTVKNIHTLNPEKSPDSAYIFSVVFSCTKVVHTPSSFVRVSSSSCDVI